MKHPFQILIADKAGEHLFASVKNHLQVFDLKTGSVVGSWIDDVDIFVPLKKQQEEKIKALQAKQGEEEQHSSDKKLKTNNSKPIKIPKIPVPGPGAPPIYNYIRSLALSDDEKYLVGTTDSDKAAIIFEVSFNDTNCLKLIKRQVFPKRPCAVSIDGLALIVADKFGDVYSISIDSKPPVDEKTLTPILGHVSMLSDVLITTYDNKKFVLTGDRDEHIRISNYPKSYVIKNWLFGHHEFVSEMHIPEFDPSILVSGGGDDYLCLWKWYEDKLLTKVELRDLLEPCLNDSHLPPERFLTENSPKEISITKILTYLNPLTGNKMLIILCENTNCINIFEIHDDFSVTHKQTLATDYSLVDICLDSAHGCLIGSIDIESNDKLLAFYQFNNNDSLEILQNPDLVHKISISNECDVDSRNDFYPLYYVNTLRKRSEH